MSGYTEQVRCAVWKMPCNSLFYANLLWESELTSVPERTYYKILERLVIQGELVHLTKGMYYRPYKNNGKIIPISTEDILSYYTENSTGVIVGDWLYEKAGIIEAKSDTVEVLSNKLTDNQKKIGNVAVRKVDMVLNEGTIAVIETMEILQNYQKLENPRNGRLLAYMKRFAESYDEETTEYVLTNRKYKKSSIAFLHQILEWYAVKNSLDKNHLSPLSTYKVPQIDDLRQKTPDYVLEALNIYVEKVKEIYGSHTRRILLYGSYARGDFTEESDIDILILLDMPDMEIKKYRHSLTEVTFELNEELELEIKPIAKYEEEFLRWERTYSFYANIKREGVELFGAA